MKDKDIFDKILLLNKAQDLIIKVKSNFYNRDKKAFTYIVYPNSQRMLEDIIITINDVWQKENELSKNLKSCEKGEHLEVITEEEEQTKDSPKEEDLNLLK